MLKRYALPAGGILLALSITGCPAVTNAVKNAVNNGTTGTSTVTQLPSSVSTAINNVLADFENDADLSGDSAGAASFLSSAQDNGSGTGVSVQSLRSVEDVSGNLSAGFTWPSPQSSASFTPAAPNGSNKPYWLYDIFNPSTGLASTRYVSRNKRWISTTTYYVASGSVTYRPPFGSEQTVLDSMDNKVHEDEIIAPEATASTLAAATPSVPAIFVSNASPSLEPASELVRSTTITFPVFGYTDGDANSAVGARWVVYNTANPPANGKYYYPIYSWIRALQIARTDASGSLTVDHYDIATDYQPSLNAAGQSVNAPTEFITDDYNPAKKTEWHNDRIYNSGTYIWTGHGYFVTSAGATHSVQTTWNAGAQSGPDVWTRTATWTNAQGQAISYVLDYNYDESGTGSLSVNGTQFATLKWGTNLAGSAALSSGQTLKYRVPRP